MGSEMCIRDSDGPRKPFHLGMNCRNRNCPVVLFIMLYKVLLIFEIVGEILECAHSSESYVAVFSCGAPYYDG